MRDAGSPLKLRRKRLAIGVGCLPLFMGEGEHHYSVSAPVPMGTAIVGCHMDPNGWQCWLLLEHESFPETPEGAQFPELCPQFFRVFTKDEITPTPHGAEP